MQPERAVLRLSESNLNDEDLHGLVDIISGQVSFEEA
jgi:hypothetical protein